MAALYPSELVGCSREAILWSDARTAAAEADAARLGFQGSTVFWFAQPSVAAALAAAPLGARPDEGKLGKLRGSAYLILPEAAAIGDV